MTGPRNSPTHPQHRRGRRLLPLAAAILLGQLGCSDQPTEPTSPTTPVAATVRHPMSKPAASRVGMSSQSAAPKAAYTLNTAFSGTGPSVLVLADSDLVTTSALANSLANAGLVVTLRPAPENTWDGTNPSLNGFDAVVHLNGTTFDFPLPASAQTELTNFVQSGGGYVTARWDGYEVQPGMAELALQAMGDYSGPEQNCGACQITYHTVPAAAGHPVLEGLPSSFTFTADAHDAGPQIDFATNPSTALMQVSSGRPAVLIRQVGSGRVVNFSIAPNYYFDDLGNIVDPVTLQDPNVQQLYINAVRWAAGSAGGTAQPQSITFGALSDKTFGDPDFTVEASASSGLPVTLTASGTCSVLGTTVSISGAGSCTITASQAGNDDYLPADDVSQSFTIHQATPVISWSPAALTAGSPLGSAQLNASATGLGGISLSGGFAYNPPAGTMLTGGTHTLSVQFTPDNANYRAVSATATVTVNWSSIVFRGFFLPVRNLPAVNVVLAGTAVPIKFTVGGFRGRDVLGQTSPSSVEVACPAGAAENVIRPSIAGSSGLHSLGYSYTYVWKTNASWAGTCRRFVLTLVDGSQHEVLFRFAAAPRANTVSRILGR